MSFKLFDLEIFEKLMKTTDPFLCRVTYGHTKSTYNLRRFINSLQVHLWALLGSVVLFCFVFVLGFELRALNLLGRHTTA
jgi:hypothetical protein